MTFFFIVYEIVFKILPCLYETLVKDFLFEQYCHEIISVNF